MLRCAAHCRAEQMARSFDGARPSADCARVRLPGGRANDARAGSECSRGEYDAVVMGPRVASRRRRVRSGGVEKGSREGAMR